MPWLGCLWPSRWYRGRGQEVFWRCFWLPALDIPGSGELLGEKKKKERMKEFRERRGEKKSQALLTFSVLNLNRREIPGDIPCQHSIFLPPKFTLKCRHQLRKLSCLVFIEPRMKCTILPVENCYTRTFTDYHTWRFCCLFRSVFMVLPPSHFIKRFPVLLLFLYHTGESLYFSYTHTCTSTAMRGKIHLWEVKTCEVTSSAFG